MAVRVVVTAVDYEGLSSVERDAPATAEEVTLSTLGGMVLTWPWQVGMPPGALGDAETRTDVGAFVPPEGFLNFVQLRISPRYPGVRDDHALRAIIEEARIKLPGLLATMEPAKGPGMHQTPTLDLLTVTSGRVVLRLDEGSTTKLMQGDCIVQRGTMHAWHNPHDEPCTLTGVMLAVRRSSS